MTTEAAGTRLYLDLMKKILINVIYEDASYAKFPGPGDQPGPGWGIPPAGLGQDAWPYDATVRESGRDWPTVAHTMVGRRRLDSLHECLDAVLADDVPGDFIETGVWRGGTCIFMRAFLAAHEVAGRTVWVADSFEGMPRPGDVDLSPRPASGGSPLDMAQVNRQVLGVPQRAVEDNFRRYGLLDDQVKFLAGWFSGTLPAAPVQRLAILRMDGDWYESTMDALDNLYPKLSPGGFAIVDDYMIPGCRKAVADYRGRHGIHDEIQVIDQTGVFWRKSG